MVDENASIDPSLRPPVGQSHHMNGNGNGGGGRYESGSPRVAEHSLGMGESTPGEEERWREERRGELRREMERMREALRGKERELEELGGVGD